MNAKNKRPKEKKKNYRKKKGEERIENKVKSTRETVDD